MSTRLPWRQCARRQHNNCLWACPPLAPRGFRPCAAVLPVIDQSRYAHDAADKASSTRSALVNPPASTRPPTLEVPQRSAVDSTFQYLFQLGKSYLVFYKTGIKNIVVNRRLLREKLQRTPVQDRPSRWNPSTVPKSFSRADWVLLWRVRHDLLRLPLFGLMILVIGEFTALVVIYVDRVVPYTCRIPKQVFTAAQRAEERRRLAFEELEQAHPHGVLSPRVTPHVARKHVLRTLDLPGGIWDRLGFVPPGMWETKGRSRMTFLEGDDQNLVEDGGHLGLDQPELVIACKERGIDTLGKSETDLRGMLGDWLRLTAAKDLTERRRRMATLLLTRPENWPKQRDFAVPDWEL
ncbi:hypothetical protein HIM_01097 [Hirsutella minnesotensis 3608]|nr:hypothetical protein HIM_01097 [Hirsutella minnesotensis 3608]